MHRAAQDLIDTYAAIEPDVRLVLVEDANRDGAAAARTGDVDIGLAARYLPEDRDLLLSPVGLDAIVVAVNAANPVESLLLDQVRRIYAGTLIDWEEVGLSPRDIVMATHEEESDTRIVFEEKVMHGTRTSAQAVLAPSDAKVIAHVAGDRGAIGYASIAWLAEGSRAIAVEGIQPIASTIRDGSYPLARPLYLVTSNEPRVEARAFVEFALGPLGQAIIARHHVRIR
jgi:phosphate transport system substrate-binding protein